METSSLQPDDFKVGMFITVRDLKRKPAQELDEDMSNPLNAIMMMYQGGQSSPKSSYDSLKGIVIRVDAINLPFVMVTIYDNATHPGKTPNSQAISLDVREVEFMRLNEDYVNAYLGKTPLAQLLQGEKFNDIQNLEGYETLAELLDDCLKRIRNGEKTDEDT